MMVLRSHKRLVILYSLLTIHGVSESQVVTPYLQRNNIRAVSSDTLNHLWFATSGGLWKYDQKEFQLVPITVGGRETHFDLSDVVFDCDEQMWVASSTSGLFVNSNGAWQHIDSPAFAPEQPITDLFVDSSDRLWIATEGLGITIFQKSDSTWHRLTTIAYEIFKDGMWDIKQYLFDDTGLPSNVVAAIEQDDMGSIWIATDSNNMGIAKFSGRLDKVQDSDQWCYALQDKNAVSLEADANGKMWAGTRNEGVFLLNADCSIEDNFVTPLTAYSNESITAASFDMSGILWLGTSNGLCRYNAGSDSNKWRCLSRANSPFINSGVTTIYNDSDNNLWVGVGADQGVVFINNNWFTFTESTLETPFIFSMLVLGDEIWVGTTDGVTRLRGEDQVQSTIKPGTMSNQISDLTLFENSSICIGVFGSGIYWYDSSGVEQRHLDLDPEKREPRNNQVNQIVAQGNQVWIATDARLSRYFFDEDSLRNYAADTHPPGLINNRILSLALMDSDTLWVGTAEGASVLDINNERWIAAFTDSNGLSNNTIKSIAINPEDQEVWLGTAGGGISIYDGQGWKYLDRTTVLADNVVNQIVFSEEGEVWVATPSGVSRRDTTGIWSTFDANSGLASSFVQTIAFQADSVRWFGTWGAGVTRYRPPKSLPQTFIESRLDVTDKSEVIYHFSASDLNTSQNEFRYQYWLDPDDKNQPTFDRFAVINVDEPGHYIFHVQAIDRDGNVDPIPATDSFHRIEPQVGGSSFKKFKVNDSSGSDIDSVLVSIYWPPNELAKDTEIFLEPVDASEMNPLTLVAFHIEPRTLKLARRATLEFSFLNTSRGENNLRVYHDNTLLGGTPVPSNDSTTIAISIDELGKYSLREVSDGSRDKVGPFFSVQPLVFSPQGGGHGTRTTLSFYQEDRSHVRIKVFNLAGRLVKTIIDDQLYAGVNAIAWDGRDRDGHVCPTGLYVITLESSVLNTTQKVVLK